MEAVCGSSRSTGVAMEAACGPSHSTGMAMEAACGPSHSTSMAMEAACGSSHSTGSIPNSSALVSFFVGQQFRSFEDFQRHLKLYESQHFVQFWCRDSRTIQAAQKRLNRHLSDEIKYYELTYRCIHGGKKFKA